MHHLSIWPSVLSSGQRFAKASMRVRGDFRSDVGSSPSFHPAPSAVPARTSNVIFVEMKACSIFVVFAALFIAKVHAESFSLVEVFSDSACEAGDLTTASYEVEDCTGPDTNGEGYEYYSKVTCSSSEKTTSFYTDTACTMDHPNITDNTETLACTSYGGGSVQEDHVLGGHCAGDGLLPLPRRR